MFSFIPQLHPNVWLLTAAQSFIGSIGPIIVFVGGFIGIKLAPNAALATLPVAFFIVGIACFMVPVVKLLSVVGRKKGFILAVLWGLINTGFVIYALTLQSFVLFCLGIFLYGGLIASVQQFRFAAMESVKPEQGGQAVSTLLLAGLVAAFLGPEIAYLGKDWLAVEFAGSFAGLAVLLAISLIFLSFFKPIESQQNEQSSKGRPLSEIMRQPIFITALVSATVGFSIMSFVMTATPISMHVHNGFDLAQTKWVIQSHIIAMYLPSFFTGKLIEKFGHHRILFSGVLAFLICIFVGFAGQHYLHYWLALVLLGIGWNFMFVAATALLPQSYEPQERFKVQGFNDLVMFSCQAIASLGAGWVIKSLGWNGMLSMCIPFLLITTLIIFNWRRSVLKQQHI